MGEVNRMVVAADAIVFNEDPVYGYVHVLLIKRKDSGLVAVPGGVCEANEQTVECARRECKEETGFEMSQHPVMIDVFDDVDRDPRGRTLSVAYVYHTKNIGLPEVKAGDDAKEAYWLNVRDLRDINDWAFPDHKEMISIAYTQEFSHD